MSSVRVMCTCVGAEVGRIAALIVCVRSGNLFGLGSAVFIINDVATSTGIWADFKRNPSLTSLNSNDVILMFSLFCAGMFCRMWGCVCVSVCVGMWG